VLTQHAQPCRKRYCNKENQALSKNKVIIIIAILMLSFFTIILINGSDTKNPLSAQVVWQKTYGGSGDDRAFYAVANNRGYLMIGSTRSFSGNATLGWLIQIDFEGDIIWNKTYLQGFGTELRYGLKLTDGYLLVGNEFLASNVVNGIVLKIDDEGNPIWNRTIGGNNIDKLFSAIQSTDGFALVGETCPSDGSNSVAWVVKMGLNGQILWNNTYSIGNDSAVRQGILAPDGSYVIAGYTQVKDYDFLALKIDQTGKLIWNITYGTGDSQKAYSITEADDGCVIVGDKISLQSDSDAWAIKVDWNGTLIWEKTVGGKYADSASVVSNSDDGNYLVSGFTFSFGEGNRDIWLFKISKTGDIKWSCTQGNSGYQEGYMVFDASKNQYIIVGWTDPTNEPALIGKAQYDFYVAKISPQLSNSNLTISLVAIWVISAVAIIAFWRLSNRKRIERSKPVKLKKIE
jgi:hypothetical protein